VEAENTPSTCSEKKQLTSASRNSWQDIISIFRGAEGSFIEVLKKQSVISTKARGKASVKWGQGIICGGVGTTDGRNCIQLHEVRISQRVLTGEFFREKAVRREAVTQKKKKYM